MTTFETRASGALASVALLASWAPAVAFAEEVTEIAQDMSADAAEEANTGMKLLLPNMAEFVPALIAFIIIWIILAKFAWPMVLTMMEERENKIRGDLDAAEQARTKAEASAGAADERIAAAEREAQEIVANARREAESERARILAEGQASAQALVAKAKDTVAAERKKAMIELSGQVVDLSVEIASKVIADALDESQQRALAERYLLEVGSLND